MAEKKLRTCYLMVKDIPNQSDEEAAIVWGVDWGLEEGEELPEDHEELSEAQYAVHCMMQTLKGVFDESDAAEIRGEKGSGLIMPD